MYSEIKSIYCCVLGGKSKLNCREKITKQMNRAGHGLGKRPFPDYFPASISHSATSNPSSGTFLVMEKMYVPIL